jgi:dephospho-CoA kinase
MIRLGLTGSIGSGKSTTAAMFADEGCAVWDADAAVHRLYAAGGAAVAPLQKAFPQAIVGGAVSRAALRDIIEREPEALVRIERIVHPLVKEDRAAFAAEQTTDISVFDIPLLFETGLENEFDAVVCVYVPEAVQRERVLARGTMTPAQLELILSKQLPAAEKAARADAVIETDTLDHAREQVHTLVQDIREGRFPARDRT